MFSRDGLTNWTTSTVEPYSFTIKHDDGTTGLLATRERPKLLFGTNGEPTHLYNGVAPMPAGGCSVCTHSRKGRDDGTCVGCKTDTKANGNSVYTMVVPLRQKTDGQLRHNGS